MKVNILKLKNVILGLIIFVGFSCERPDSESSELAPKKDYSSILKELEFKASNISQKNKNHSLQRSTPPTNSNNPNDSKGLDYYDNLITLNNDSLFFTQQFESTLNTDPDLAKYQLFEHLNIRLKASNIWNMSSSDSSTLRSTLAGIDISEALSNSNPLSNYSSEDGYTNDVKEFLDLI